MLAQAIKKRLSKEENQKGFTLIELLAVIVILGIISVIAVPLIGNIINNSKKDADVATARQIYDAARLYIIGEQGGDFISKTVTIDGDTVAPIDQDLVSKGYLDEGLVLPSTKAPITTGTVTFDAQGQLSGVSITAGTAKTFTPAEVLSSKKTN